MSEIDGLPIIMLETPAIWNDGSIVTLQLIQRLDDVAKNLNLLKLILIAVTALVAIPFYYPIWGLVELF